MVNAGLDRPGGALHERSDRLVTHVLVEGQVHHLAVVWRQLAQAITHPQRVLLGHHRLLHRVRAITAQSLDGGDDPPLGLGQGDCARPKRHPVDQHHARAAAITAAARLGAGEVHRLAQRVEQRHTGIEIELDRPLVDGHARHGAGVGG